MKKILSTMLAASMLLSMGVTAFAEENMELFLDTDDHPSGTDIIPGVTYMYEVRRIDGDREKSVDRDVMDSYDYIIEADDDLSVSIRRSGDEYYAHVRASTSLRDEDATLSLRIITLDDDDNETGVWDVDFDVDGNYSYYGDDDTVDLVDGVYLLAEFDKKTDDITYDFDGYAEYVGAHTGSNKKTLYFDSEFDYDLQDDNPDADLEFLNFSGVALDYGQMTIYTDLPYIYEVNGNSLHEVSGAKFNSKNEEITFRTNSLKDYVLSDIELDDVKDAKDDEDENITTPSTSTTTTATTTTVNLSSAVINGAKRSGSYAVVNIGNNNKTSGSALSTAGTYLKSGEKLILRYVSGNAVKYQWYIDAKNASSITSDFNLGVTTNYATTETFFEKYFSNNVEVIRLAETGSIGATVSLAVKADLSGLNTSSLYAYLYNPTTNKYAFHSNPTVDSAGYVRLNLTSGGDIVLTDKPLTSK